MFITPAYTIKTTAKDGGSGLVFGYSHHGNNAGDIAKGLSLVYQHKVFVVTHEDAPDAPVQHWANGHRV